MDVEEIELINPKISRKNGWNEFSRDNLGGCFPDWVDSVLHSKNCKIPEGIHPETSDGKKIVWIDMDADVRMHFPKEPVAELAVGKITIHFRDWERVEVLKAFVADSIRKKEHYPKHIHFLRMIPTVFLLKKNRAAVIKKLDKLIEGKNSIPNVFSLKRDNLR